MSNALDGEVFKAVLGDGPKTGAAGAIRANAGKFRDLKERFDRMWAAHQRLDTHLSVCPDCGSYKDSRFGLCPVGVHLLAVVEAA